MTILKKLMLFSFAVLFAGHAMATEVLPATANDDIHLQLINSEILKLQTEKAQKTSALNSCANSVNGFRIAGIVTGAATIGLGIVDIVQHNKINALNDQIEKTNQDIKKAIKAQNEAEAKRAFEQSQTLQYNCMNAQGTTYATPQICQSSAIFMACGGGCQCNPCSSCGGDGGFRPNCWYVFNSNTTQVINDNNGGTTTIDNHIQIIGGTCTDNNHCNQTVTCPAPIPTDATAVSQTITSTLPKVANAIGISPSDLTGATVGNIRRTDNGTAQFDVMFTLTLQSGKVYDITYQGCKAPVTPTPPTPPVVNPANIDVQMDCAPYATPGARLTAVTNRLSGGYSVRAEDVTIGDETLSADGTTATYKAIAKDGKTVYNFTLTNCKTTGPVTPAKPKTTVVSLSGCPDTMTPASDWLINHNKTPGEINAPVTLKDGSKQITATDTAGNKYVFNFPDCKKKPAQKCDKKCGSCNPTLINNGTLIVIGDINFNCGQCKECNDDQVNNTPVQNPTNKGCESQHYKGSYLPFGTVVDCQLLNGTSGKQTCQNTGKWSECIADRNSCPDETIDPQRFKNDRLGSYEAAVTKIFNTYKSILSCTSGFCGSILDNPIKSLDGYDWVYCVSCNGRPYTFYFDNICTGVGRQNFNYTIYRDKN